MDIPTLDTLGPVIFLRNTWQPYSTTRRDDQLHSSRL